MTQKLSVKVANHLLRLMDGESIAYSQIKHALIDELINEGILFKKGKHRQTIQLANQTALQTYLSNQWQIQDLAQLMAVLQNEAAQRADLTAITGDSKYVKTRSFQGFLLNSDTPIDARLHGEPITIAPNAGTFTFIYDYDAFIPDATATIVGVENSENFRHLERQRDLFADIKPLFLSRYPQSQHKDVIRWLRTLPNRYLHFGDIDLAGISIYLSEYKKYLGERASFFIPPTIATDLSQFGNRKRYADQRQTLAFEDIDEPQLKTLLALIHREQKGLDQEFYLRRDSGKL